MIKELSVVREFSNMFQDDISDVPPEREMDLSINIVPCTKPIFMAPYKMSTSELEKFKNQLEDLFEKEICETMCITLGSSDVVGKEETW